ncbi:hypothetical protein FJY71_05425 [candidate division WOR-3 bacterium]|nr:hypothetical protein [candidate division WOR-3 bacterium]
MEGLLALLKDLGVQSSRLSKHLQEYGRAATGGAGAAFQREKALAGVRTQVESFPDSEVKKRLAEWCAEQASAIEQEKEEFRFGFGRDLLAALEGSGMAVRGQVPVLRVGLFTVKADIETGVGTVYWGPEIERLKSGVKLAPAELATTLRQWHESLRGQSKLGPEEFLGRLHTAHRRICMLAGLPEGSRVFLVDLLGELVLLMQPPSFRVNPARERFVEYPRIRFSYDLYRLKQAGAAEIGGARLRLHVANFDATTEKAKALWVPDNETGEGTHYSYASFPAASRAEGAEE